MQEATPIDSVADRGLSVEEQMLVKNLDTGVQVTLDDFTTPETLSTRTSRSSHSSHASARNTPPVNEAAPSVHLQWYPREDQRSRLSVPFDPHDPVVQQCLAFDEQVRRAMWQVAATPTSVLPMQLRALVEREESTRAQAFQTALLQKQLVPYAALLTAILDNLRRVVARERIKPQRLSAVIGYLEAIGQHRVLAVAAQSGPPPPEPHRTLPSSMPSSSARNAGVPPPRTSPSERLPPLPSAVSSLSARPLSAKDDADDYPRASGDGSGGEAELSGYYTTDGSERLSGNECTTDDGEGGGMSARSDGKRSSTGGNEKRAEAGSGVEIATGSFNVPWAREAPGVAEPTKEVHVVDEPPAHLFKVSKMRAILTLIPTLTLPTASPADRHPHPTLYSKVRGPRYLDDRIKEAAEFHAMSLLGVDLLRSDSALSNVCDGCGKAKMAELRARHGPDIFLVNFQLPVRQPLSIRTPVTPRCCACAAHPRARWLESRPITGQTRSSLAPPLVWAEREGARRRQVCATVARIRHGGRRRVPQHPPQANGDHPRRPLPAAKDSTGQQASHPRQGDRHRLV